MKRTPIYERFSFWCMKKISRIAHAFKANTCKQMTYLSLEPAHDRSPVAWKIFVDIDSRPVIEFSTILVSVF